MYCPEIEVPVLEGVVLNPAHPNPRLPGDSEILEGEGARILDHREGNAQLNDAPGFSLGYTIGTEVAEGLIADLIEALGYTLADNIPASYLDLALKEQQA